ncbi:efflux RND transporter periplasmic adaptor subunit [Burkholderia plantarii]|uniref:efflux RND transporter periplasmic adaptor subunit n=1 Tax=Burkholderia plantarii TaxID=41899 RepID=UPI0018DD06A7|nr:efflux RND transporter periplasmic adaptor subunit [Burkholderia plantarii]MBI0330484.1 efflux transporter periplasmic adaptor subunit [Burkholderia plantarii]
MPTRLPLPAERPTARPLLLALMLAVASLPALADTAPTVAVEVAAVTRGPAADQIRAYGIVAASAANALSVSLPYAARVTRVLVQPGQRVARGAPLFVVEADPAAVTALVQARSAATLAHDELVRTGALLRDGLATASQLAAARKADSDAREALAAQTRLGVSAGAHSVPAPADAIVSQLSATSGDRVQAGAALAQLVAADNGGGEQQGGGGGPANVMLGVEPADALLLHPGDAVTIGSLSARAGNPAASRPATADGRVMVVGASVDPQSQLVDVGAAVPLAGTALIPGTRVYADIAANAGTWWNVPRPAVLRDAHGACVYQVGPDARAHRIAVTTRVENDRGYGVDGPLHADWPLVVSGNYELADGMAVRVAGGAKR